MASSRQGSLCEGASGMTKDKPPRANSHCPGGEEETLPLGRHSARHRRQRRPGGAACPVAYSPSHKTCLVAPSCLYDLDLRLLSLSGHITKRSMENSLFARARLAQLHSKTHATEQDACDGQGRVQDACLDAVAATKAEETPHTKGGS